MSWIRWAVLGSTIAYQLYKKNNVPKPQGIAVGEYRRPLGASTTIGIPPQDRLKHTHLLGATGTGKTTLIKNLVVQDLRAGHGLCVIDPKSDLIDDILLHIPDHRVNDVVLFDATDTDYPIGFNILEWVPETERSLTASAVVSVFRKLHQQSTWGPRLEYILRHAVVTLLEVPGSTLLDLPDILNNREYLQALLQHVQDPTVLNFWHEEYLTLSDGQRRQSISPILNKVGPWLTYPECRNIVTARQSSFNLRQLMDNRKILLVKIPHGLLGEDISAFLGAMLVAKIQLAAMTRADLPPGKAVPFFLYVDEFQNFVTNAFEKILTEARSFGLGLIVANQHPHQLTTSLFHSLENNVAARITCQRNRGAYHAQYQMMQDVNRPIIDIRPMPPPQGGNPRTRAHIRQLSRQKYARSRREAEAQLRQLNARCRPRPTPSPRPDDGGRISFRDPAD